MREVKSVKVDNWGVFFLQKLQNFFNKTDYCDLTLQFQDNSQLKVHRLVLSACTDYFNVLLEQSCEVIDDILIMPRGLQADVIVPIVNFMYTGTLEFEIEMYGRLLKTARDMNMTVLLKLLEAHKRTVDTARNNQQQIRRGTAGGRRQFLASAALRTGTAYVSSERRAVPVSSHQLKTLQIKPITPSTSSTYHKSSNATEPASLVAKYPHTKTPVKGPSRFECNDESTYPPDSFEMFDSISYESKPLITANQVTKEEIEDYDNMIPSRDTSSTFEQLRKSYTGQKRPLSVSSFESPPEKKPNIEDVKEYAEQQRMRKQIAAEFDDDHEYDDVLDDEFHNDDDDEDYVPPGSVQRTLKKTAAATSAPPAQHQIVIKNERADSKPTIVVKDTVGSNVSHTKIISEVLKKYPHLVKNNKNIKLKIMAKTGSSQNQEQSIIIKQENDSGEYSTIATTQTAPQQQRQAGVSLLRTASTQVSTSKPQQPVQVPRTFRPQQLVSSSTVVRQDAQKQPLQQRQQQKPLQQKDQVAATVSTHIVTQKIPVTTNPTPRRIDSKTMHSLIAMGAENTTGPWLCLRCGVNGRPISIPSYRGFRRHLVNTHRERIDRRLCEHCGWRSRNDKELLHHLRVQHDILPPQGYDDFPACSFCPSIFLDKVGHEQHMKDEHPDKPLYQQQCMYCDGLFKDEGEIYNHMQSQHKAQAQNDGLIDYTDEEDNVYFAGEQAQPSSDNKIKILSSITISPKSSGVKAAAGKLGAEALSSVATGIAASLGLIDSADNQEIQYLEEGDFISGASTTSVSEPKFVNADGQIMELTAEQRDEIISQLQSQPEGGVVMVLNQESFNSSAEIKQEDLTSKAGEDMDVALLAEYDGGSTKKDAINEWQNEFQNSITKSEKKVPEKTEAAAVDDGTEKAAVKEADVDEAEANADADTKNETVNQDSDDDDDEESGEAKKVEDESEKIEKAKENLKLLTGDWSDDEEEEVETTATTSKSSTQKEEDGSATKPETDVKEETDGSESGQIIFETSTASNKDSAQDQDEEDGSGILHADEAETDATSTVEEETTADKTEESVVESTVPEDGSDEQKEEAEPEEATSDKEQLPESTDESNEKDKNDDSVVDDDEPMKDDENVTEKSMDESVATEKDETENGGTEKKEEPSGEHIRTLISEWGDEDEEED